MPITMANRGLKSSIQKFCVSAAQMQTIEAQLFDSGFPIAALMEKVAGRIVDYGLEHWERAQPIGVLVGPGHNGGDALVVARELYLQGYDVMIYAPFERCKPLTDSHGRYCRSLGIPWYGELASVLDRCALVVDGLFGFGLSRPLTGNVAAAVTAINQSPVPVVSIDLPSGIHTDSGEPLGTAIRAQTTLCLGLWKWACLQEVAQPYLGQPHLIDFDIPLANIEAVVGAQPRVRRLTHERAIQALPLKRSPVAHKYTVGQLLVIAGSRQYVGAALLTGHGAMASGVGMVTLVVPESLRSHIVTQLPGALVVGAQETPEGTIATLPLLTLERYNTIACGPGLAQVNWLAEVLALAVPLLLDADGLNGITAQQLSERQGPTVITPHPGEFRRLFPALTVGHDGALGAAAATGATVVLKGAKVATATPKGLLWLNPESTPALARGGSGDVLTGLMGGLMAQQLAQNADQAEQAITNAVLGAIWWHAQAGIYAHQHRTVLGVDPSVLTRSLNPALAACLTRFPKPSKP
ncbi:MAG: NAD(P)H-hydrate dehydratase [Cyanobacteria bacterium P01_B01_bin.77]